MNKKLKKSQPHPTYESQLLSLLRGMGMNWIAAIDLKKDKQECRVEATDGHELSFDNLQTLSTVFQTKKINIGTERRNTGGCETCNYSYNVPTLDLWEVTWPMV